MEFYTEPLMSARNNPEIYEEIINSKDFTRLENHH